MKVVYKKRMWTCEHCRPSIPEPSSITQNGVRHDISFEQLASNGKCEFCKTIVGGLREYMAMFRKDMLEPLYIDMYSVPGQHIYIQPGSGPIEGRNDVQDLEEQTPLGAIEFFYDVEAEPKVQERRDIPTWDQDWMPIPPARLVWDLADPRCMDLANEWTKDCVNNHSECVDVNSKAHVLPTRVLDVSGAKVRLLETNNQSGTYLVLSHCWGREVFFTTTMANYQDLQDEVPVDRLSRTFRDAIHITKSLAVDYLWIDSLCIIQDSAIDWEHESAKMDEVYSMALLTIAATSAASSREGCFVPLVDKREYVEMMVPGPRERTRRVVVRPYHHQRHAEVANDFPGQPLNARAWIFQEWLLSTRILYFSALELAWTCKRETICQCGPSIDYKARMKSKPFWQKALLSELYRNQDSLFLWMEIVAAYSKRLLTFEQDILPALSGVAKILMRLSGDDYLAGLWRTTLPTSLLWSPTSLVQSPDSPYLSHRGGAEGRTDEYCAPTWSWASLRRSSDYLAKWIQLQSKWFDTANVIDCQCTLAGPDPTGRVIDGRIILNSHATHIRLRGHEIDRDHKYHRCRVGSITCESSHDHVCSCISWNEHHWAVLDTPEQMEGIQEELSCFLISRSKPPNPTLYSDFAGQWRTSEQAAEIANSVLNYYLLLRRKPDHARTFERIGIYITTGDIFDGGAKQTVEII